MSDQAKGKFSEKHPPGARPDPELAQLVQKRMHSGRISCAAAHKIAHQAGTTPAEIGRTIDLLEGRLEKCQLGLFGYGPEKKVVKPAPAVSSELQAMINAKVINGKLSCSDAWQIAQQLSIGKLEVAAACETLAIKIKPCQLGAF